MAGDKYRLRCIGQITFDTVGRTTGSSPACGWTGVRTDHIECECYAEWRPYCHPLGPGPGCPRGIAWPCPRCKVGAVTGRPVRHRQMTIRTTSTWD